MRPYNDGPLRVCPFRVIAYVDMDEPDERVGISYCCCQLWIAQQICQGMHKPANKVHVTPSPPPLHGFEVCCAATCMAIPNNMGSKSNEVATSCSNMVGLAITWLSWEEDKGEKWRREEKKKIKSSLCGDREQTFHSLTIWWTLLFHSSLITSGEHTLARDRLLALGWLGPNRKSGEVCNANSTMHTAVHTTHTVVNSNKLVVDICTVPTHNS